ncbi:MAG: PDZ domain-containing protein [Patescibacteria group bacterium]
MTTSQTSSGRWWGIGRSLILAVVAGAGAGVVAAVWTSRSLDDYAASLLAGRHLPQVSTQQPTPIPGTYEEALSRVRENARTGVAAVMPVSTDSFAAKSWLSDTSALGYGAIVSDDGWVAVDASVLDDVKNPLKDIEVWMNGKRYAVQAVVRDSQTSAAMLHTTATGLSPLGFASTNGDHSGEMMFAVDALGGVFPNAVAQSDEEIMSGAQHAETFTTDWALSASSPSLSSPLLNAAGELAGFARAGDVHVLPLHQALHAIRSVVKTGANTVAMFGAYSIDLAHAYNIDSDLRQNLRAGALLFSPDASVHATVRGGPAAEAGFASKDIILAVDGESVTDSTSLAEILALYDPGDVARCTVLRAGQTMTISVTLGDTSTLVY